MSLGSINGALNPSCEIFYNPLLDIDMDSTSIPTTNLEPIVVNLILMTKHFTVSLSFLSKIWNLSSDLKYGVIYQKNSSKSSRHR